ncbi:MAG: lysine--tRNA ligase [Pseudomonadota bacterium]
MSDQQDDNTLIAQRREKLAGLREAGNPFPNDFRREDEAAALLEKYDGKPNEFFDENTVEVSVAGRMMVKRVMGKASFCKLQDTTGRVQLFVQRDNIGEAHYAAFKQSDIGDIYGAKGALFVTKTGELSVRVRELKLLTKSLRPLPEKWHGLTDQEQRYRQRYVDLIINESTRETFRIRAAMINYLRNFLNERGYLEIESPMMQVIPGGAAARPFVTHHNALDMDLYLRIAQELPIKRCLVGGFDRVYEMNRIFRNEGLSTRHNPEFTMLEYNEAYQDYHGYMDLTEDMIRGMADSVLGSTTIEYQGETFDFGRAFDRVPLVESILQHNPEISRDQLNTREVAATLAAQHKVEVKAEYGLGKIQMELFDVLVEDKIRTPTFITEYPAEVSPLSRRKDDDPNVTERFELFIGGREIANGFSELNDAEDQAMRFREQVEQKDAGDDEAMYFDADYIRALEYGLPPNAGGGIGIDRLVMLFTDSASIRDVLLFPHMRPEADPSV